MRAIFLVLVFLIPACARETKTEREITQTKTQTSQTTPAVTPPPSTTTVVLPPPTTTELKVQLDNIGSQIQSVTDQIQELKDSFRNEIQASVKATVGQSTVRLQGQMNEVTKQISDLQARFSQRADDLEKQLQDLSAKQASLSDQLADQQKANASNAETLNTLSADIKRMDDTLHRLDVLAQHADSNSNLALIALKEMADKKVGGFLGLGSKHLLSEVTREAILSKQVVLAPSTEIEIKRP